MKDIDDKLEEMISRETASMMLIADYIQDKETIEDVFEKWERVSSNVNKYETFKDKIMNIQADIFIMQNMLSIKKVVNQESKEDLKYITKKLEEKIKELKSVIEGESK